MAGPLAGLRVIDFGQYVAGPLAAVMLADQGAEVVHVDPPGGPKLGGFADAFLNRGKRRVMLDLKDEQDRASALRLVETADVVIENFRPGVMERLGLGATAACSTNPRLVCCSIPGFSSDDLRAQVRAWEGVLHAATANSSPRVGEEPPGWDWARPTYTALPLPSCFGGYLAATSIVMALIARHRTGRGQTVEVPLFNATFALIGHSGAYKESEGLRAPAPIHGRGAGCFRCKDGRYVQFDTSAPRHLTWFARAAGVTGTWGPGLLDLTEAARPEVNERLHGRLRELFLTRSAEEWEAIGNEAGAAISLVRTTKEWLRTEHARATGASVRVEDPVVGELWCAGLPVYLSEAQALPPQGRHLPGEDNAEVLADLRTRRRPEPGTGAEPDLRHPLEGLKVLDLGMALAGPTCGRLLSEFGADVVKVSPTSSDAGGYVDSGKRSLLVDLRSLHGQDVFWRLLDQADVVLENMSPSTMSRLGLGYEEARARRPDIVYTGISCYGWVGPWTSRRGWERQGQAATGIMERTALPSVLGPYNLVDNGTGVLATFATGLALYHRLETGRGQMAGASLCQTATYHQCLFAFVHPDHESVEPRGYDALGEGPFDRFYPAADRWFYLAARPGQEASLAAVVGVDLAALDGTAAERTLEDRFRARTAREWVEALVSAGIGAHVNVTAQELMEDHLTRAQGLAVTQEVDGAGLCTMPGPPARLSETPMRVGAPPGRPGSDGANLLTEIGLGDQVEALHERWVVRSRDLPDAWPKR